MTQDKRSLLLQFLERGTVMIHLDARRLGVVVPERFRGHAHLRLNLDYAFRIPDFDIGEEEIVATLSFSQKPYRCVIPWNAIWGITSDPDRRNVLFPDSIPPEIAALLAEATPHAPKTPTPLRVVAAPDRTDADHEREPRDHQESEEPEQHAEHDSDEDSSSHANALRRGPPPSAMPTPVQNPAPESPDPAAQPHEEPDPKEPTPPLRRGHLRLIKS